MVDHNAPDCFQEHLAQHVVGVIDHHEDKHRFDSLQLKDVRFCGAAVSLVAKRMLDECPVDKELAFLMGAPIIIDTVFFKESMRGKKWDEIDHEVYT